MSTGKSSPRRQRRQRGRAVRSRPQVELLEERIVLSQNAVVTENALPGTPQSVWQINNSGDPTIQGFTTDISYNVGQTVSFKIDTPATSYHLDIYRMGYYQGDGARLLTTLHHSGAENQPGPITDPSTGLMDYGDWAVSDTWAIPTAAVSGIYFANLTRDDTGGVSQVFFVVRNDASTSDVLFQTSDATWEAYNSYGGNSLYQGTAPAGRAYKVSYNRPFNTGDDNTSSTWILSEEYPMVRWMEQNGYDVSYFTDVDSDRHGSELLQHKLFLSVGHDEYWSGGQEAAVTAARDAGVNLAFFSGNENFWKVRWENSIDGSGTPYRTLVCYKETAANAPIDPQDPSTWTGTWRDPRWSPPADGGRPENALTGTLFEVNASPNTTTSITVPAADAALRFWRNTSIAQLAPGTTATLPFGTLGFEWDEDVDNGSRPAGLIDLSTTTVANVSVLQDYGNLFVNATATHHLTLYRAKSGALVFGAGTVQWDWGLDNSASNGPTSSDMQQATVNLFADMGVQPGSLQAGLVPATASTDHTPPTSVITSPSSGQTDPDNVAVTIHGTATDAGGGVVAGVEVSVDGGTTWHPATIASAAATTTWSYTWMPIGYGPTTILSRATDDSANIETPGPGITANRVGPFSIWSNNTAPLDPDSGDATAVEVGVKFRSDYVGTISGIRFYKGSGNTGTHTGELWTSTGTLLATATFTGETATGWQTVTFATPVAIAPNTTYIASYHTNTGHYAADNDYFLNSGVDTSPLHALKSGVDGVNGTYVYGASNAFPNSPSASANYWVDVVFNLPPASTTAVSASANPSTYGQTVTFTARVTHTSGGTGTATGTVTFMDGTTVLGTAPVNASGQATFGTWGLAQGAHSITAVYGGDANFAPSTSAALSETIGQPSGTAGSSTTLASSANPSVSGQGVTFTATVSHGTGGSGTPTGVVLFKDGTTPLGLSQVNASGQASVTVSGLAFGNHSISASYSGDGTFAASSASLTQTSNQASTTTGLVSSSLPAVLGQTVTFTATVAAVAPASGTPTGAVTFKDGTTTLGTASLNASGQASFSTAGLALGPHSITAAYGGDSNFTASTSAALSQPVNQWVGPSTIWSASAAPSAGATSDGNAVEVGVKFRTDKAGYLTGIRFYKGSANTGTHTGELWTSTGTLLATATFSNETASGWQQVTFATPVAINPNTTYVASYHTNTGHYYSDNNAFATAGVDNPPLHALANGTDGPDGVYVYSAGSAFPSNASSASNYWVDVVYYAPTPTTTTLTASAATTTFGQALTLTATVSLTSGGPGTPTGTVTFKDGSTTLGTVALDATDKATLTLWNLSVGSHSITAVYGGDSNFTPSTSAALTETINQPSGTAASATALASSANPSVYGQAVTLTVTVSAGSGTPTGAVSFKDGSTTLGAAPLNGSGQATFTTSGLALGAHALTAVYSGDNTFASSTSSALSQTVNQDGTTTVLASSANPATYGQALTLTATVAAAAPGSGTPTGTVTFKDGATVLGTAALNASGQAALTTWSLVTGSHSLTAAYGGDTNFTASTASALSQTMSAPSGTVASSTTVTASANPLAYGPSVTFTATVTAAGGGGGVPTASIIFKDGPTNLGSAPLNSSGQATFTTSGLVLGPHSITAVYSGDSTFAGSTSVALIETVNRVYDIWPSTATPGIASYSDPGALELGVKFRSDVAGLVTGVRFYKGSGNTGTHTGELWTGTGTLLATATFTGETASGWQTVTFATPVAVSPNTTFVASYHTNTGHYAVDSNYFATSGVDNPPLHALASGVDGTNGLYLYGASSAFPANGSSANYWVDVVFANPAASTTALTSSANPSLFGQPITLTATASPASGAGIASGTVTFKDGTTVLGTVSLDLSGQATLTTSALSVGTHAVTASYGGDTNFGPSTSTALTQTVNQVTGAAASTTALASSVNPSVYGQSVTLTATVSGGSGTPTGTVTFKDGTTTLGIANLNTSGQATLTLSSLVAGSHSLTGAYSGDATFAPSTSAALSESVNQDGTATALSSSANPTTYGQALTLTATVAAAAPGSGTPTGTVTFKDGATTLGTAALNASGQAAFTTATLATGSHSLTAVYAGDANFTASTSAALAQTVNLATTAFSIWNSSATPAVIAEPDASALELGVKFTADVAGLITGIRFYKSSQNTGTHVGNLWTSTGTLLASATFSSETASGWQAVTFASPVAISAGTTYVASYHTNAGYYSVNSNYFASAGVDNPPLHALANSTSPDGVYVYSASSAFPTGSSSASNYWVDVTFVTPASSTTTLTSSASPTAYGQSVTFTATVSGGATGTPTGTVTFKDGSTALGTGTLNASGQATLATSTLAAGSHSITAVYGGDSNFAGSTSSALTQTVNQDGTATTLASSLNPSTYGQTVTLAATVSASAPGSGTPTGTVTFKDGTTTLGTATLNASGQASFSTWALGVGAHSITAAYGGDSNFTTSTSAALSETVNPPSGTASSSTTVASSANPATYGQAVTFTATVSAGATGVVTFKDGTTVLGTSPLNASAQATFTTSTLAGGSHSITAVYSGDNTFASSTSAALTETVNRIFSIWSDTTTPGTPASGDGSSVELGVKFRSDVSGSVTGIRFYKGSSNTGTHLGNLWTSTGTLLATATFTGETASGWQTVTFATPVAINPNTTYVASYHTSVGHYAFDTNYFATSGADSPPLHALANGVDGPNGLYIYGASSTFPTGSSSSSNYWIDVTFVQSSPLKSASVGGAVGSAIDAASRGETEPQALGSWSSSPGASATVGVYVDNRDGSITPDESRAIDAALAQLNRGWDGSRGLHLVEVADPGPANIVVRNAPTSAIGGMAQGTLGCTDFSPELSPSGRFSDGTAFYRFTGQNVVTLLEGWNWYAGSTLPVPADAYDYQTAVTHELGHAVGLDENGNSYGDLNGDGHSPMYPTVTLGSARRQLGSGDVAWLGYLYAGGPSPAEVVAGGSGPSAGPSASAPPSPAVRPLRTVKPASPPSARTASGVPDTVVVAGRGVLAFDRGAPLAVPGAPSSASPRPADTVRSAAERFGVATPALPRGIVDALFAWVGNRGHKPEEKVAGGWDSIGLDLPSLDADARAHWEKE
jgi:hypothetical protein